MARIVRQHDQDCGCVHGCETSATITEWDCSCVTVEIHNNRNPGRDCTDFSGMRERCGQVGDPEEHPDD